MWVCIGTAWNWIWFVTFFFFFPNGDVSFPWDKGQIHLIRTLFKKSLCRWEVLTIIRAFTSHQPARSLQLFSLTDPCSHFPCPCFWKGFLLRFPRLPHQLLICKPVFLAVWVQLSLVYEIISRVLKHCQFASFNCLPIVLPTRSAPSESLFIPRPLDSLNSFDFFFYLDVHPVKLFFFSFIHPNIDIFFSTLLWSFIFSLLWYSSPPPWP